MFMIRLRVVNSRVTGTDDLSVDLRDNQFKIRRGDHLFEVVITNVALGPYRVIERTFGRDHSLLESKKNVEVSKLGRPDRGLAH